VATGRQQKRWAGVACVAAVALAASAAAGASRELDAASVAQRLQAWLDATRDFEAGFEQTLASGALGTGLAESGRLYLWRPGRMRWDYLEPERKVALVDGESTWLYLEEDSQLWEGRLEDDALLATLLAGARPLDTVFDSALLATPRRGGKGAYRLQLVPRTDDESFQHVVLTLRPPEFAIEAADVLDAAGNLMQYRFVDLRRNEGVSESVFHFEPPPGTEIVRP
jgi:outer membrane lipoprotein carrier protein